MNILARLKFALYVLGATGTKSYNNVLTALIHDRKKENKLPNMCVYMLYAVTENM